MARSHPAASISTRTVRFTVRIPCGIIVPSRFRDGLNVLNACVTFTTNAMANPKRIQVKETQRYWGDLYGTLESIIAALQAELDAGWVGIEYEYEPYEDGHYYLYKYREENDKEYNKRMEQLEKEKVEKAKAKERKLEQLKKDLSSLSDADKKLLGL